MQSLELKFPPPLVLIITAVLMGILAKILPIKHIALPSYLPIFVLIFGIGIGFVAVRQFRQAQTIINPKNPEQSSQIIKNVIFSKTRNPMYLGMAIILCAWALWLSALTSWLGVVFFVLFITRFQIIPEENILKEKFADEFISYCKQTRRWI